MNANELADELENTYPFVGVMEVAATMLRQQQAEIDLLRMTQPNIDYDKELLKPTFVGRELTDEEIVELGENNLPNEAIGFVPMWQWIEFARAILRKAQEK